MNFKLLRVPIFVILFANSISAQCTVTTVSGSHAPQRSFCAGELIFEDNFDNFDLSKWHHEVSMWGGGNNEFQWYVNDRANSFTQNGILHLRPTLTSEIYGEEFIYSGRVQIPPNECTNSENSGCDRSGEGNSGDGIVPPIRSALVNTFDSFRFKYGILEIRAKNPAGDWLWPALWLMPRNSVYGPWPRSGEIDLMETRGNTNLWWLGDNGVRVHVGTEQVGSTLHFGPSPDQNAHETAHALKNRSPGFDTDYHIYKLIWTPFDLQFYYDGQFVTNIEAGSGFWDRGGFGGQNIWPTPMAPFDQEFYIIMNNAVGGVFFYDGYVNYPDGQTWSTSNSRGMRDFWEGRWQWEPTWNMNVNDDRDLKIDYVRVYAL